MAEPIVAEKVVTEEEALNAGYKAVHDGINAAEPVTNAEPAVVVEPVVEPPVVEPVVDPWDGVPGVVRESHEAIAKQLGTFTKTFNEHRSDFGRIAAALQRLEAGKAAAATVAVADAPTPAQIAEAAKSLEKWNKQKEEFPEWAEATDERFAAERAATLKLIPHQVDVGAIRTNLATEMADAVRQAERRARSFARVDAKHENWEADILSPNGGYTAEFAAWNAVQLPEVQILASSENPQDAIKMLDAFYASRTAIEAKHKNQARLAAVVAPKVAPSSGPQTLSDDASLLAGYNRVKRA